MEKKISEISELVSAKIKSSLLNKYTYISTENMVSNFGGVGKSTNIPPNCNVTAFNINDILISNIRPYFKKIWLARFNGGCSNDVLVLRTNKNVNCKYLFYALINEKFINYYVASCKGTKMPRGNKDALLEWKINVPNFDIQQHIVNTIGSVDDLIENYQKRIDKIANILTKSIEKYSKKVTIDYYHPIIIKSGIDKFNNIKNYLDTSSVDGINNISSNEEITYDSKPSRANMQPIPNSLWFAKMKGSYKNLIVTENDADLLGSIILSTGFLGIKATKELPLSLLTAFVISKNFNLQRDLNSVGTTMAGINNDTFLKISVPLLSKSEVKVYDNKYKMLINELSILRRKINILKQEKTLLLNKYF